MDAQDNGYFIFDAHEPPLYVRQPSFVTRQPNYMCHIWEQYRQECLQYGLKHSLHMLPCCLTAGEISLWFIRNHRCKKTDHTLKQIQSKVVLECCAIFHVPTSKCKVQVHKHIRAHLFKSRRYKRNLRIALRNIIIGIHRKTCENMEKLNILFRVIVAFIEKRRFDCF
jgi:hypothetical protein